MVRSWYGKLPFANVSANAGSWRISLKNSVVGWLAP
jgi:hypothetical protein